LGSLAWAAAVIMRANRLAISSGVQASIRTGNQAFTTPGASSMAASRTDGVDWADVINTRDWPPNTSPTLNDLGNSITQLLNTTPLP